MVARIAWIAALVTFALPGAGRAQDCAELAKTETERLSWPVQRATLLGANKGESRRLLQGTCPPGGECAIVYFAETRPKDAPPSPGAAYAADRDEWTDLPGTKACPHLSQFVYVTRGAGAKAALRDETSLAKALPAFAALRATHAASPAAGAAHGDFPSAVAETLQILGQIVVDRAAGKAYQLISDKLQEVLGCTARDATRFAATCAALASMRLEDLAMAPRMLLTAFAKDLMGLIAPKLEGDLGPTFGAALTGALIPLIADPALLQEPAIRSVFDALDGWVAEHGSLDKLSPAGKAVAIGVLAYTKCAIADPSSAGLRRCDVSAIVDSLGVDAPDARPAARVLAGRLIALAAAPSTEVARAKLAVDTFFATACMLARPQTPGAAAGHTGAVASTTATVTGAPAAADDKPAPPALACPDIDTLDKLDTLAGLALARALADAVFSADPGQVVVVAARFIELKLAKDATTATRKRRGLRLLGGLLSYAATYASSPGSGDAASLHDQRSKILESLTRDMSDRTGREGDDIWSLGGSLRVILGGRVGFSDSGNVVMGPLSLPLGLSFTHIPIRSSACGFHFEANAFDLGNYLSFDQGPGLKTPEVGDALAPGIELGVACGRDLPYVVTGSVSYTPRFLVEPSQADKRGSINIGVTFGIHVPVIDLN